jgi:phosphoribosylformylglycinamidine cyclo-ligase
VNDIAVQGATPLYFLDYLAVGKLDAHVASQIVSGIARGCKSNGCALIGGETAEMPGLYQDGEYDLAGTIVGAAEKNKIITGAKLRAGDLLLGLPSAGLHTNGFSLARKILFEAAGHSVDSVLPELGRTLGEELLQTHRSYLKPIQALSKAGILLGAAHITGGGISDNLPRILPRGLMASIDTSSWTIPAIFELMQRLGNVPLDDYRRTFNLGIGMVLAVPVRKADEARRILKRLKEDHCVIGELAAQKRGRARVDYR